MAVSVQNKYSHLHVWFIKNKKAKYKCETKGSTMK